MNKFALILPLRAKLPNVQVLCFDPESDTIILNVYPKHKSRTAEGETIDDFLDGDDLGLIDLRLFFAESDIKWFEGLNNVDVLRRIAVMKTYLFCDALNGGFTMASAYAAFVASLAFEGRKFVSLHNMETDEVGVDELPDDFNEASKAYEEIKGDLTEYNRDWIGGAVFMSGHYLGNIDTRQSTSIFGGRSIIPQEGIKDWLPVDETNPMTQAIERIVSGEEPTLYSWDYNLND